VPVCLWTASSSSSSCRQQSRLRAWNITPSGPKSSVTVVSAGRLRMALKKSNIRLICLSAFYVFFLLIGATIFSAIEGPIEVNRLRELLAVRTKFLQNRRNCLSGQYRCLPVYHLPYGSLFYQIVLPVQSCIWTTLQTKMYASNCYRSSTC